MAADPHRDDARRDLELLVDGAHATGGGRAHEAGHRVGVRVLGEVRPPGDRVGPEVELAPGHDQLRVREQVEVADVVVVQVRHHDLLHLGAVDPEPGERVGGLAASTAGPCCAPTSGAKPESTTIARPAGGSRIQK